MREARITLEQPEANHTIYGVSTLTRIRLLEPAQAELDEAIAHQHRKLSYWRGRLG